jgi:hypothetical protein
MRCRILAVLVLWLQKAENQNTIITVILIITIIIIDIN